MACDGVHKFDSIKFYSVSWYWVHDLLNAVSLDAIMLYSVL